MFRTRLFNNFLTVNQGAGIRKGGTFGFQTKFLLNPLARGEHSKVTEALTEVEYNRLSNDTLEHLSEYLENLGESIELSGYDCECSNGVLTLKLGTFGTFVINRQPANKQIWLSSPISGPKRYNYSKATGEWLYEREELSLYELLETEISKLLGRNIGPLITRTK